MKFEVEKTTLRRILDKKDHWYVIVMKWGDKDGKEKLMEFLKSKRLHYTHHNKHWCIFTNLSTIEELEHLAIAEAVRDIHGKFMIRSEEWINENYPKVKVAK